MQDNDAFSTKSNLAGVGISASIAGVAGVSAINEAITALEVELCKTGYIVKGNYGEVLTREDWVYWKDVAKRKFIIRTKVVRHNSCEQWCRLFQVNQ